MPEHDDMNGEDKALVDAFLSKRDEWAFRSLYRSHSPRLYPLAVRLAGSESDAHDALQEMWVRACRQLTVFAWKSSLRTWLTGILINCVREAGRNQRRHQAEEISDDYSIISAAPSWEGIDLEQLIARLPSGYRQVLTLHDVEGYTHEEIGTFLAISDGTSKSQLFHARQLLRSMLREESFTK